MSDAGNKWMLVLVAACIGSNLAPSWVFEQQSGYGIQQTYVGYQALWNRQDGEDRELNLRVMAYQNGAFLVGAIGIFIAFRKRATLQTPLPTSTGKSEGNAKGQ